MPHSIFTRMKINFNIKWCIWRLKFEFVTIRHRSNLQAASGVGRLIDRQSYIKFSHRNCALIKLMPKPILFIHMNKLNHTIGTHCVTLLSCKRTDATTTALIKWLINWRTLHVKCAMFFNACSQKPIFPVTRFWHVVNEAYKLYWLCVYSCR